MSALNNIVQYPTKRIKLPQSGKIINLRPFIGKEQKSLKYALESEDKASISSTFKNCIQACITEKVNVGKLSLLDIEYLFLQIIIMSNGNIVNVGFPCFNEVDGKKCGTPIEMGIDLNDVQWPKDIDSSKTKEFTITESVKAIFKKQDNSNIFTQFAEHYVDEDKARQKHKNAEEEIIAKALVTVYHGEEVINAEDEDLESRMRFVNDIAGSTLYDIEQFVSDTDNTGVLESKFKCPKCKFEHTEVTRGIENFFV